MTKLFLTALITCFVHSAYAIYAGLPTDKSYDAIGSLKGFDQDSFQCTATLIAPDWIVTAEHCRNGGSEEEPFEYKAHQLSFSIGEDSSKVLHSVRLKKWIAAPSIRVGKEDVLLDVAFAQLEKPVTHIRPIPISLKHSYSPGSSVYEIVGFGESDESFGRRLKGEYQVTTLSGNAFENIFFIQENFKRYLSLAHPGEEEMIDRLLGLGTLIDDYEVHAWDSRGRAHGKFIYRPEGGWFNTCFGDSGGPMLLKVKNKMEIVGIISGGFNGDYEGCVRIGSRIALFGPKIRENLKKTQNPQRLSTFSNRSR